MSRRRRLIAIGAASVVAMAGLGSGTANAVQAGHQPGKDKKVLKILNKMTLEEKVAQLFVLQVYGTSADTTDPRPSPPTRSCGASTTPSS